MRDKVRVVHLALARERKRASIRAKERAREMAGAERKQIGKAQGRCQSD